MKEQLPEQRYPTSFRVAIGAVVDAVPISRYLADTQGMVLTPSGARLVGHCPSPDHEDKTPSFTIWDDRTWTCFGCDFGSGYPRDVVALHMLLDDHAEMWTAMEDLSMRYAVVIPGRSYAWHAAQDRRCEYQDRKAEALGEVLEHRLFRLMVLPYIDVIEDDEERERDLQRAWAIWNKDPSRWATFAAAIIS